MARVSIQKVNYEFCFRQENKGRGRKGQIREATLFGRSYSLKLPNGTVKLLNRGSFIDFLNAKSKNKKLPELKKGWFFGNFGSSDAQIKSIFDAIFKEMEKEYKNKIIEIEEDFTQFGCIVKKESNLTENPTFMFKVLEIAAKKDTAKKDIAKKDIAKKDAVKKGGAKKGAGYSHEVLSSAAEILTNDLEFMQAAIGIAPIPVIDTALHVAAQPGFNNFEFIIELMKSISKESNIPLKTKQIFFEEILYRGVYTSPLIKESGFIICLIKQIGLLDISEEKRNKYLELTIEYIDTTLVIDQGFIDKVIKIAPKVVSTRLIRRHNDLIS